MRKWILLWLGLMIWGGGKVFAGEGPIAWWKFDEGQGRSTVEAVSGRKDSIEGNFRYAAGVRGTGLKCDGFTTRVICEAGKSPALSGSFTVEAWIVPQEYPWNWCAIVNQEKEHGAGYFFGIDQYGHVGLQLAVEGKWYECTSEKSVPFMRKWSHVAGTFDKDSGISLYIDGQPAGSMAVKGAFTPAAGVCIEIGRNHKKTLLDARSLVRKEVNFPTSYSFDGIIDDVKIYGRALSAGEIGQAYQKDGPGGKPDLQWRRLPEVRTEQKGFGAFYCRLKFYPEWDALWRVDDYPDVVVNFDEGPYKMVFWHGTSYNMNLVTENGIWVGDQSAETGAAAGCAEHMSDKHCRYAHVRIIENNDARVVVHWRYALCDVLYNIAGVDKDSGWGVWADEYYYIYPDGLAVRNFHVHGASGFSVTEPTVLNNPGQKAEDNISLDAVTVGNMSGEIHTFRWDPWPVESKGRQSFEKVVPKGNLCILNLKSLFKPCYVYEPRSRIGPYGWPPEVRPEYSHFPTWNHWPVSQAASDGRYALFPDRVSSSAITSPRVPERLASKDSITREGQFIMGFTDRPMEELLFFAGSWVNPAELKVFTSSYKSEGYRRNERAYVLSKVGGSDGGVKFELCGSDEHPVFNPVFVIMNWGDKKAKLVVDGREIACGKEFRFGHRRRLEGSDLVVWLKMKVREAVKISLVSAAE